MVSESDISRLLDAIYLHKPLEKINLLLDRGIDVNYSPNYVINFLNIALQAGNLEAAKLLIERGADVNWTNRNGMRPISFVPLNQGMLSVDLINLLVNNGANIDQDDIFILPFGIEESNPELVGLLNKYGAKLRSKQIDPLWAQIPYMDYGNRNLARGAHQERHKKECNIL